MAAFFFLAVFNFWPWWSGEHENDFLKSRASRGSFLYIFLLHFLSFSYTGRANFDDNGFRRSTPQEEHWEKGSLYLCTVLEVSLYFIMTTTA